MRKQKNKTKRKYRLKKVKALKQPRIKKIWINKSLTKRKQAKIKKKSLLRYVNKSLHIICVTFFRRNIFLTVVNVKGEIKVNFTAGQFGFKGKNKVASMAITETTLQFFKLVWKAGIRVIIIKYNGYHIRRRAFRKGLRASKKIYKLKILGLLITTQVAFNGSKRKKRRRL